jgi:DNA-binding NarL/FixJ family response regulator
VIILTVFDDDEKVFSAIQSGASGYLLKEEKADAIVEAIEEVMKGHAFMSPAIARKTLTFLKNVKVKKEEEKLLKAEDYHLTQREIEILECVNDGLTYNQIAEKLFISSETVKSHIKNIFQKLQVNSKLVAAQIALKNKWFERRG